MWPVVVGVGRPTSPLLLYLAYVGEGGEALTFLDAHGKDLPVAGRPNSLGSWALLLRAVEGLVVLGERERPSTWHPLVAEAIAGAGTVLNPWETRRHSRWPSPGWIGRSACDDDGAKLLGDEFGKPLSVARRQVVVVGVTGKPRGGARRQAIAEEDEGLARDGEEIGK